MSAQPWLDGVSARDLAISVFRNPGGHASLLAGRGVLPVDVVDVMRLAQEAARHHDDPAYDEEQHRAALFFVEHVLLGSGSDHYRVLGLARSAHVDAVRDHYRLMMAIFHPDRCPWLKGDRENLAARINVAYRVLRDPATRAAYDLDHGRSKTIHMPGSGTGPVVGKARAQPEEPLFSRLPLVVQRFFPQFVLGGVAMVGLLVVLATYISRAPPEAIGMGAVRGAHDASDPSGRVRQPLLALAQDKSALADAKSASPVAEAPESVKVKSEQPPPLPHVAAVSRGSGKTSAAARPSDAEAAPQKFQRDSEVNETRERPVEVTPAQVAADTGEEVAVLRVAHQVAAGNPAQPADDTPESGGNAPHADPKTTAPSATVVASHRTEKTGQLEVVAMAVSPTAPAVAKPLSASAAVETPNERGADPVRAQPASAAIGVASAPIKQQLVALQGVGHREAIELLARFTDAYRRASLDELMALFSENARSNSGRRDAIRSDYEGLFRLTRARDIEFHDLRWTFEDERGKAEGSFVARVLAHGQDSEGVHVGILRIELVKVSGRVLIEELFHSGSN